MNSKKEKIITLTGISAITVMFIALLIIFVINAPSSKAIAGLSYRSTEVADEADYNSESEELIIAEIEDSNTDVIIANAAEKATADETVIKKANEIALAKEISDDNEYHLNNTVNPDASASVATPGYECLSENSLDVTEVNDSLSLYYVGSVRLPERPQYQTVEVLFAKH